MEKKAIKKRKEVKFKIMKARKSFVTKEFENCKNNVRKYRRNMACLLNKRAKPGIKEITIRSGKCVTGKAAPEAVNDFFCNIGNELARAIPQSNFLFEINDVNNEFIWDKIISNSDVEAEIKKLNIS